MIRFKMFMDEEFLSTSIDELPLDNRSDHALKHAGISTIGKIIENWNRLMNIHNLGSLSVKKIRAAVFAANLERIWEDDEKMQEFARCLEVSV